LKLLLEEQYNFFHVSARCHAQSNAYSLAPDLYVSAEEKTINWIERVHGRGRVLTLTKPAADP